MSDQKSHKHPDRIGPYHIVQVIGEGGMGVVHEGEQKEPVRRRVAIKTMKVGMDTKEVVGRFEAERQALAVMGHPAKLERIVARVAFPPLTRTRSVPGTCRPTAHPALWGRRTLSRKLDKEVVHGPDPI